MAPPPGMPMGPNPASGPSFPHTEVIDPVAAEAAREKEGRKRRRLVGRIFGFVSDRFIPLLIAVLTLVATLATTWGAVKTSDANELSDSNTSLEETSDGLEGEVTGLQAQIDELTQERDELEATVADLRSQQTTDTTDPADPDSGPTTGVTTPAPPGSSTILRQTGGDPLEVGHGYSIDLDTDAANWGVKNGNYGDLYFNNGSSPALYTREIALVDYVPTESECENTTVRQPSLSRDQTRQGVQFCMRTNQDRWSYVHIAGINTDTGIITLDLTVWE